MAVATAKRLPPVDLVWRIYNAQLQHGKRGAPARAYRELRDQHGYVFSDQWLYNLLSETEPAHEDELSYTPAPGELEYRAALAERRKRQARRRTGKPKRVRKPPKTVDTVLLELPTEVVLSPIPLQPSPMIMSSVRSIPTLEMPQNQNSPFKHDGRWVAAATLGISLDICAVSWKLSAHFGEWWLLAATIVLAVLMARVCMQTLNAAWPLWKGWVLVCLLGCFVAYLAVIQL